MRHRVKKIKFANGVDANRALVRKLAINFFLKGKLSTTFAKVKAVQPSIDKLVEKMKIRSEANVNYLKHKLNNKEVIEMAYRDIGPAIAKINGGYTRVVKLGKRESDGAEVGRLEWVYPVVKEVKKV